MRQAGYIILGKHKQTGDLYGYTENSFSMGIEPHHVRVNRDDVFNMDYHKDEKSQREVNLKHTIKDVDRLNKTSPDYEWSFYRVGSKKCTVKLDWERYWALRKTGKHYKYEFRNLQFEEK